MDVDGLVGNLGTLALLVSTGVYFFFDVWAFIAKLTPSDEDDAKVSEMRKAAEEKMGLLAQFVPNRKTPGKK